MADCFTLLGLAVGYWVWSQPSRSTKRRRINLCTRVKIFSAVNYCNLDLSQINFFSFGPLVYCPNVHSFMPRDSHLLMNPIVATSHTYIHQPLLYITLLYVYSLGVWVPYVKRNCGWVSVRCVVFSPSVVLCATHTGVIVSWVWRSYFDRQTKNGVKSLEVSKMFGEEFVDCCWFSQPCQLWSF